MLTARNPELPPDADVDAAFGRYGLRLKRELARLLDVHQGDAAASDVLFAVKRFAELTQYHLQHGGVK